MSVLSLSTNGWNHYSSSKKASTLFVATTGGVVKLVRDDAGAWKNCGIMLEGVHISSLVVDSENDGVFVGLHPGGLMYSANLGETWEKRDSGINHDIVYSLRLIKENGNKVLYAGTEPASLYRSTDYGKSWTEIESFKSAPMHEKWQFPAPGHNPHLKTMAFDPRDPNVMYCGVEQGGLIKTTDGGKTWQDLDAFFDYSNFVYKDIHQILLRPTNPDEVFMPTGLGLFHSKDGGISWDQLTDSDFRIGYPDQLIFDPKNDSHLFMSGGFAAPFNWIPINSAKGTIVISDDAGKTWREPKDGFPEGRANVEAMSIMAYDGGYELFAGTTDGDVFISSDEGETWTTIVDGLNPVSKPTHDTLIEGVAYGNEPPM